jgi:hypothetical protein
MCRALVTLPRQPAPLWRRTGGRVCTGEEGEVRRGLGVYVWSSRAFLVWGGLHPYHGMLCSHAFQMGLFQALLHRHKCTDAAPMPAVSLTLDGAYA